MIPVDVDRHFTQPAGILQLSRDDDEGNVVTEGGLDDPAPVLVDAERDNVGLEGFQDLGGHGLGVGNHLLDDVVPENVSG